FQAEDGIRDLIVTGVQTCALPISSAVRQGVYLLHANPRWRARRGPFPWRVSGQPDFFAAQTFQPDRIRLGKHLVLLRRNERSQRSEERRVGKESSDMQGIEACKNQ